MAVDDFDNPVDRAAAPGCCRSFLERQGFIMVARAGARTEPYWWKIRRMPLESPLPRPELQRPLLGDVPPDRGQSYDWPHPQFEEE